MSVRVITDTHGAGLAALATRLHAGERRVLVGVPAGPVEADGLSVAQVAAFTEFGTSTAPERPFLRPGIRKNLPEFRRISSALLPRVADGAMTMDTALGVVGAAAAGAVQKAVIDEPAAPNAPSTIKAKGSDRPRVDSGIMRHSITHVVEGSGGVP